MSLKYFKKNIGEVADTLSVSVVEFDSDLKFHFLTFVFLNLLWTLGTLAIL